MRIRSLRVENFRNYALGEAELSPGVTIISGENGQGKTNLLEAVYCLAAGRSYRTRFDRELIRFGESSARVSALVDAQEREQELRIDFAAGRKRVYYAAGVRKKTAAEFAGRLTAVLFSPDDLYMIKEGPAARRRLMDMCISQLRPRYAALLSEYNRALEQKMRILRYRAQQPSLTEAFDDFSELMCLRAAEMIRYRAAFAGKLSRCAAEIHGAFSGGRETLGVRYATVSSVSDPLAPAETILEQLRAHMAAHRRAELEAGTCLSGVHRDDLLIDVNGAPARTYASQGQTRTAALSIKLAERRIHFEDRGEYPVLLLDDVLSELDAGRRDFVVGSIRDGQVLITCCEDTESLMREGARLLRVENGRVIG